MAPNPHRIELRAPQILSPGVFSPGALNPSPTNRAPEGESVGGPGERSAPEHDPLGTTQRASVSKPATATEPTAASELPTAHLPPTAQQLPTADQAVEPLRQAHPLRFLAVHLGDTVVVAPPVGPWWIGRVIHREGGARCDANAFFQVACIDTGVIRTLNADAVVEILTPAAGSARID